MENKIPYSAISKQIKIGSTLLMLAAIALYIWQRLAPLPAVLEPIFLVAKVAAMVHIVEGAIAAALIFRYRLFPQTSTPNQSESLLIDHLPQNTVLAIVKAGLYAFFVGTIGLVEIIKATKATPEAQA